MRRLKRLSEAVKAISPQAEIRLRGIPDREDWWVCIISAGDAILVESAAGPLDAVIDETTRKVKGMSTRIRAALGSIPGGSIPPPPDEPDPDSDHSV